MIGGLNSGEANAFAFNGLAGVAVLDGTENSIRHNLFNGNGGLAIDLGADGVTPNDDGDADGSPNHFQNSPAIDDVTLEDDTLSITYHVTSDPTSSTYPLAVDFYRADEDGQEGRTLLLSDTFAARSFPGGKTIILDPGMLVPGDRIVAIATDAEGNTSEFSMVATIESNEVLFVTTTSDSGNGSLRQAIIDANEDPGPDIIHFDITGDGVHTIHLLSPLPAITDSLTIDGTTQTGFALGMPVIELDGTSAGVVSDGLMIDTDDSVVKGLVINRFTGDGIAISGSHNSILGNFIGTNAMASAVLGNAGSGILISDGDDNLVGGMTIGARNIIAGNARGITIAGVATHGSRVQGNLIGTNPAGADLGNLGDGVRIDGASDTEIGGLVLSAGNRIAFNHDAGIAVLDGIGNTIRLNSLTANLGLAIDLGADGVTPNDAANLDADGSPNGLQNFPLISSAKFGSTILVSGTLQSKPHTTYTLDFYANHSVDPLGHGEGERYLGSIQAMTDAFGVATFFGNLPEPTLSTEFVSASATGPEGTSEFSVAVATRENRTPFIVEGSLNVTIVEEDGFGFPVNMITENQLVQLIGNFTDDDFGDSHTINIEWGDGTQSAVELKASDPPQRIFAALHQYLDDNPTGTAQDIYRIAVTIADDTGSTTGTGIDLTIKNQPPQLPTNTLAITRNGVSVSEINERDTVRLVGAFTDVGSRDTHAITVDWGDGVFEGFALTPGARTFNVAHTYRDDNAPQSTPIQVTLMDDDQGTDSATLSLNVHNIAPVASIVPPVGPLVEGAGIALEAAIIDGAGDTFDYYWIVTKNGVEFTTGTDAIFTFTPDDNALYSAMLVVTDDDGASSVASPLSIVVPNAAPVISPLIITNVADVTTDEFTEADLVKLSGSFTDLGPLDDHVVRIDWGNGSTSEVISLEPASLSFATQHVYLDDPSILSEEYAITVLVRDKDQGSATVTRSIIVNNANPRPMIIDNGSDATTVRLTSTVSDPGIADSLTFLWSVSVAGAPFDPGVPLNQPTLSFPLTPATVYTIQLTASDDDGGTGVSAAIVVFGTDAVDGITVNPRLLPNGDIDPNAVQLQVVTSGVTTVDATVPSGIPIIINAFDSDDRITVDAAVTTNVMANGAAGDDIITGGAGNDVLNGGAGIDVLLVGGGDDILVGIEMDDNLAGGTGNDEYFLVPGSDKTLTENTGEGIDTLNFSRVTAQDGISLDLSLVDAPQTVDEAGNTITLIGEFENVVGSDFDDDLSGNDLDNQLMGGLGEDVLFGDEGNDRIDGGGDFDSIVGGGGADSISGGGGNDTIQGSSGRDMVFGDDGDDVIDGEDDFDSIGGGSGRDSIHGGGASDTIQGSSGRDTLFGDEGDDRIDGGDDFDSI